MNPPDLPSSHHRVKGHRKTESPPPKTESVFLPGPAVRPRTISVKSTRKQLCRATMHRGSLKAYLGEEIVLDLPGDAKLQLFRQ